MFELTIAAPDGHVVRRIELSGQRRIKIGRSRECDIQLPIPAVSRKHAEIEPLDEGTWVIRDLDSTHGCLVKGERIRELTITPGLEVHIGPAVLKFDDLATRIGAELDRIITEDDASSPRIVGTLDEPEPTRTPRLRRKRDTASDGAGNEETLH